MAIYPSGFYNFTDGSFPHFRTAYNNVLSGTANARILFLGDSTTFGVGAGNVSNGAGQFVNAWPSQLATLLPSALNASISSRLADGVEDSLDHLKIFDSRLTIGSGVAQSTSPTVGGFLINLTAAGTTNSTFSFHPTNHCDTFEVYTATFPGNGTITVAFNGGATVQSINTNAASGFIKTTITTTLGDNTLNLAWSANGDAFLGGIIAYNSAVKELTMLNSGALGATIGFFDNNSLPWTPTNSIPVYTPDLTIIDLTINDINAPTDTATFKTRLTDVITTAQVTGDVLLVSGNAESTANASTAAQQAIVDAMHAISTSLGVPMVDIFALLGSFSLLNANGDMFDDKHPNTSGYALIAANILTALLPQPLGPQVSTTLTGVPAKAFTRKHYFNEVERIRKESAAAKAIFDAMDDRGRDDHDFELARAIMENFDKNMTPSNYAKAMDARENLEKARKARDHHYFMDVVRKAWDEHNKK